MTKGVDGIFAKQKPSERDVRQWDLVYEGEIGLSLFEELIADCWHSGDKEAIGTTLRVHIRTWEYANSSFPLEPYVQLPEAGLMTSGIPAGTLVLPVHPDQVGDRNLKCMSFCVCLNTNLTN